MSSPTKISEKKIKLCSDYDDDVDRLSNLPEFILYDILALLPIQQAVATSLLSRRWRYQWRNIHTLNFADHPKRLNSHEKKVKNGLFESYVNKVLILLNGQCLEEFSLRIFYYTDVKYVTTWLDAAVSRNTKVLTFSDYVRKNINFELPRNLFTCPTLEVLLLNGSINFDVPNLVFLPKLKSLSLEVIYQSDESVSKFISGCPLLETLRVSRWRHDNVFTFTISSPTLRNLIYFEKYIFPDSGNHEYKLVINAPALRYLWLEDGISKNFCVENLYLLDEAKINLSIDKSLVDYDHYSEAVAKFFEGLRNVKNLSVIGDTLMALSHAGLTTSFPRLSQLTVQSSQCCKWNSLLNFFEGSNKLEVLKFLKSYHCRNGTHENCWRTPERMPVCLLSSLKTISLGAVVGLVDELEMVAYILKNATVLKTMTIQVPRDVDAKARSQLFDKISQFPRGSTYVKLDFC